MSVLGLFLLGEKFFERPVQSLSGGEKSRLLLASLFLARANLLLLDEPTNHLDLESREALMQALDDFPGTLLFVAHDRWLLQRVAQEVWELTPQGLVPYDDFASYDADRRERLNAPDPGQQGPGGQLRATTQQGLSREEAKELKRRQAELRNTLYRELKPKRQAYEKLEAELETVLDEMGQAEQALADPEVYADHQRSKELLDAYTRCKEQSETLFERMSELEEEIQELEARREELSPEG